MVVWVRVECQLVGLMHDALSENGRTGGKKTRQQTTAIDRARFQDGLTGPRTMLLLLSLLCVSPMEWSHQCKPGHKGNLCPHHQRRPRRGGKKGEEKKQWPMCLQCFLFVCLFASFLSSFSFLSLQVHSRLAAYKPSYCSFSHPKSLATDLPTPLSSSSLPLPLSSVYTQLPSPIPCP